MLSRVGRPSWEGPDFAKNENSGRILRDDGATTKKVKGAAYTNVESISPCLKTDYFVAEYSSACLSCNNRSRNFA
jgi:hypothetical protein